MKDLKNQKILIGLLIFIMSLMLILTFKFTFLDSKKLKNVEPQNTQTNEEEIKEIEDKIKEDEVLTEEHKEEMTQEEKEAHVKGEAVGVNKNSLILGEENSEEYGEQQSKALYKELIKLAETASYVDIVNKVDNLKEKYRFSEDYNLKISDVYLDATIMLSIAEGGDFELGQKGYMVSNSKDPYMLLINTLMLHERERREVIMETSSLSPMFEGPVRIKDTKIFNSSNKEEDTQAKIIIDNEFSIKELYQIDFEVEKYPLRAYVIRYSNNSIALKTIVSRDNVENPYKPISYWINLDGLIYKDN